MKYQKVLGNGLQSSKYITPISKFPIIFYFPNIFKAFLVLQKIYSPIQKIIIIITIYLQVFVFHIEFLNFYLLSGFLLQQKKMSGAYLKPSTGIFQKERATPVCTRNGNDRGSTGRPGTTSTLRAGGRPGVVDRHT